MKFFSDDVLLGGEVSRALYAKVKYLPVVDIHCHLDPAAIARNGSFENLDELWLAHDHYKWRAMRLCGVKEEEITGTAGYARFLRYASVMPLLAGNPLYDWTHRELRTLFGIEEPLNEQSARRIYDRAGEVLAGCTVRDLLKKFNVEYVATTDDPAEELFFHGKFGETTVAPTFRPDKIFSFDRAYLEKLGRSAHICIRTLDDLLDAVSRRLDDFCAHGCTISDHGFERFPLSYAGEREAGRIFSLGESATPSERESLFGYLLVWLAGQYARRGIAMQLHFGVKRNVNARMYLACGPDAGFDVISSPVDACAVLGFLQHAEERPETILYPLCDSLLPSICALMGAFRDVRVGPAWWFNDTKEGILRNLSVSAEYAVLGRHIGMLTDSRSFSSYVRFDFFRRILCNYVGGLVERGEYDELSAPALVRAIAYDNAKELISK